MKFLKWILLIFIVLFTFLLAYFYSNFRKIQPQLQGELKASGLQFPVRIIRDIYAIPHIYAENTRDLLFAQGYVTAQDRLWQMDLSRRIATGRLSEIFEERTFEIDYFFRAVEITEIAGRIYENLDELTKEGLVAYSSGVNHYIKSGEKPLESIILRYDIEPWNPIDSISIHLLSAFDLSVNMDQEIFAIKALNRLGEETLSELLPDYPEQGNMIIPDEIRKLNLNLDLPDGYKMARERFGLFQGKGASNSWVIDGTKSLSGKPILANDPHLRIQIPSVWHEIHLKAPGLNAIGVTFPGSPYVLIGHNEKVAWGFTDAMADRVDLFVERINPNNPSKYWYVDHWEDMRIKKVEIKVKERGNHKSITKEINYTRHGPVINPFKQGMDGVISMRWTGGEVQDQTLMATLSLNTAKNIEEAREGKKYAKIYTLNMVYADVDGNIGYQLIGGIPLRGKEAVVRPGSLMGNLPAIGWDDEYEWQGFIPDNELPHISNPPTNFIATANNKIVGDDFPYLISNSWAPPHRYERIVSLLQEKGKLSLEDFKRIQADVYSVPARKLVAEIFKVQADSPELRWVLKELSDWNFEVTSTSLPALLYEVIRVNLLRNTFRDELGEIYSDFLYTLNFNYNLMDKIISDPQSHWWDDTTTPQLEGRDEIVAKSIEHALREIEEKLGVEKEKWAWGQLHQYNFVHPLGQVRFLDKIFNFKPVPAEGDRDTINDSYFSYGNPYDTTTLPSYRFIIDLSDISNALGMNSTGQSGNPFSGRYSDTIEDWSQIKYHPLLFDDREIEENKWKELVLRP